MRELSIWSADRSIFGAENSRGAANTEAGLLRLSCRQSPHLPPRTLQRPRQPRVWLMQEYILNLGVLEIDRSELISKEFIGYNIESTDVLISQFTIDISSKVLSMVGLRSIGSRNI